MKYKIIFLFLCLEGFFSFQTAEAYTASFQVQSRDVHDGYIIEKIWLNDYALPQVSISGITYLEHVTLPRDAKVSDPTNIKVVIGLDRKRPFAVVHVPVFVAGSEPGSVNMVSGFSLEIQEQRVTNRLATKVADVPHSALSQGTWYKIGITQTGFYKIDYNFISSLGLSPGTITPANMRILGNGGNMLPEDNSVARLADLTENAIWVNGGAGNVFNNGDYAVFYGVGPLEWDKDSLNQKFVHANNLYTDTAYYFISFDQGPGLRITQQTAAGTANKIVTDFNYYDVHDLDLVNPASFGKQWYGEEFAAQLGNTSQNFSFEMGAPVSSVYCSVYMAGTCGADGSYYSVAVNGQSLGSALLAATPTGSDNVISSGILQGQVTSNSQAVNISINYFPADATGLAYLNYIELNARRPLIMAGDQLSFRDWKSTGPGNIAAYQLQGANSFTQVWDVTNRQTPVVMSGELSGRTYTFTQDASMLHEFAAMNSANLFTPKFVGKTANQDLHGTPQCDLIIVSNPAFFNQAQQLANYHRTHDNLRVIAATTEQVYNEFSSGGQDVSAIRDFARMFFVRAGTDSTQMPRYLILFGGASYDYKNRLTTNSNFVPVYESAESNNDINGYSTDDFYGFLEDSANIGNSAMLNILDIGVGRLPARNTNDATALVDKIISYAAPATLGPWRVATLFVADNCDDAGNHLGNAETMAATVDACSGDVYNEDKDYIDAAATVSTPAGDRCPSINAAIDNDVFKGTFLINYNGHGNTQVWASERVLTQDDFNTWNNPNMLPFMVTATCDFGQFDHPQYVSAAEQLVLRANGGVITVLTTTAAVYADYNVVINSQYLAAQFTRNSNYTWNTFGDACRIGKNITYMTTTASDELANFRKFAMLGDPAITPDFPQYKVKLDSIMDAATLTHADTIKALGAYVVYGSVHDNNGNVLTDFNGEVSVSFYDKPLHVNVATYFGDQSFNLQNNIVYKGRVTVTNGLFSLTFITPKDINYFYGTGKISAYAQNGVTDAAGADTGITVGGFSDNPVLSTTPPVVRAYIGDSLFMNGGITGNNTSLFVSLYSLTGINVSGTSIGHDLTAVLDGNTEAPYILNDYYESAPNTYQRGYVSFPVNGLADGKHTFTVKAWDVNDNVGEGSVDFVVVDGKVVDIQNLMNYPNPFNNTTTFVFEHNHPDEQLDAKISIYNIAGGLVKNIEQTFIPEGSRTSTLTWDGTDNNGARLPSGVYVYRLNISTDKGFQSSAYQKLVIVR